MHVAFITSYDPESPYQVSLPPLGIGYLSSYLKKHCWYAETSFHHTVEEILSVKPDIVAVSSTTENFQHAINMAEQIKEELNVPVVLGGMHITSLPTALPKVFDIGCVGEGEQTFVEMVNLYNECKNPGPREYSRLKGVVYHDNGSVAMTPGQELIKEMDSLPYPDRELIDSGWKVPSWDTIHMVSSRGCPYKCSFCSSSLHWKRFRFFSPDYVANEIEYLRNRYNPEILYFFDDLFVGHIGRWRQVVKLFKERGLHKDVHFRAYARVDLVTEQMADEFAELNFKYIDFGFESNSQPILKFLTKTRVTPEINQRAMDLLGERHLSVGGNFIIGSPPETKEMMQETYDFMHHNRDVMDRCGVGPLQPLPGTPIWNLAKMKGLVDDVDFDWSRLGVSYETFDFDRFPYMAESISREDFMEMYTKAHHLAKEINYIGHLRRVHQQRMEREHQIWKLESKLKQLQGSRLIQLADKIRGLKKGLFGSDKKEEEKALVSAS